MPLAATDQPSLSSLCCLHSVSLCLWGSFLFLQETGNGPAVGAEGNGPVLAVVNHLLQGQAQRGVDGRGDVGGRDAAGRRLGPLTVGRADHLAAAHPAAGEEDRARRAPVVAAALLVEARRPP